MKVTERKTTIDWTNYHCLSVTAITAEPECGNPKRLIDSRLSLFSVSVYQSEIRCTLMAGIVLV